MSIGIFGRGRLASAIRQAYGSQVTWCLGRRERPPSAVPVAIDCSAGAAVSSHLDWAIDTGTDLVIAATGWHIDDLESRVGDRVGVVLAPNGSFTVALLTRMATLLGAYGALDRSAAGYLLDHHHGAKLDAPSGTALRLAEAWRVGSGGDEPLDIASLRAGHEVGTHVLGLDTPGEQIELSHRVRSRAPFAQGLLRAARWIEGRRGLFTMDDVAHEVLDPIVRATLGEAA